MALTKEITKTIYGEEVTFPNAYIRIEHLSGSKDLLTLQVVVYKDNSKEIALDHLVYEFAPSNVENSPRWDKQGYEYMKTLPEYDDAVDVLEEGQVI